MPKKANSTSGIFKRTDIKISVLINCFLIVIILLSVYFLAGINNQAISDAMYEKGKILSILGAKSLEISLEAAINDGDLTLDDAFDSQYIPVDGSDPQLFHTKYDTYIDEACSQFNGTFFKDSRVVYARYMDLNGYVPLKGVSYIADSKSEDSNKDPLAKQILAGKRISRAIANTVEGFVQPYISEDNNENIWEFSTPVYVKGKRWGAFSVGLRKLSKTGTLAGFSLNVIILAAVTIILSCVVVFGIVLHFLKPIPSLAKVAGQVADGNVDHSVDIGGSGDIATLAEAIERLRVSLKLSMDRMARK